MTPKTYLGDSVYAEIDDSGQLVLTTENGEPDDPSNTIYLDPGVWSSLVSFVGHAIATQRERERIAGSAIDGGIHPDDQHPDDQHRSTKFPRSQFYLWTTPRGDATIVVDRDGEVSVTNDAEAVVDYVLRRYPGRRIIYRDSQGEWAELDHDGAAFVDFVPLSEEELKRFSAFVGP